MGGGGYESAIAPGMYFLRVLPFRLQQVKDAKALRECEINNEKDQTNITTAEISKKKHSKFMMKVVLHTLKSTFSVNESI